MGRVLRRLFTLAAAASAVLLVLVLLWWARTFLPADLHVGGADGRVILLFAEPGLTRFWRRVDRGTDAAAEPVRAEEIWQDVRRGRYVGQPSYVAVPAGGPVAPGAGPQTVAVPNNAPPREARLAGVVVVTEPPPGGPGPDPYRA